MQEFLSVFPPFYALSLCPPGKFASTIQTARREDDPTPGSHIRMHPHYNRRLKPMISSIDDKPKPNIEHVSQTSADIVTEQVAKLKDAFPECFTEGKVDFDKLRAALGDEVDARPERYSFSWAGKREAIRLLQIPSRATLIPRPEESVSFDQTANVFIEGENLEVLKLLYKPYFGRVKMIYIDPPYNTGNDFIYPDNYTDPLDTYLKLSGQKTADGNLLTSNPEKSGRYHSSWLSMMYPRLFYARQLLAPDGAIFISIDDHEVHNLRMLMNELYGEENFIATIIWQKVYSPKNTARHFSEDHDYIVVYARNAQMWRPELLPRTEEANARYDNPDKDPRGDWKPGDLTARNYYSEGQYEVTSPSGKKFRPSIGTYWRVKYTKFLRLDADKRIWWGPNGDNMPALKRFLSEVKPGIVPQTLWLYEEVGHTQEAKKELLEFVHFENTDNVLDTVKPTRLIQKILQIGTDSDENDIVLDFFAGSAATAHGVLSKNRLDGGNRRFVSVQLQEPLPAPESKLKTLTDIGKTRIYNVIETFDKEDNGKLDLKAGDAPLDLGFRVFQLGESNYKSWLGVEDKDPATYAKKMALFTDTLVDGWKPENVVWEIAIKEGYGLNTRIDQEKLGKNVFYRVTEPDLKQRLWACLDDKLDSATLKSLELRADDLFVCRDGAVDDTAAANLALQCRLKTI